jgi:glutaredoxin 3
MAKRQVEVFTAGCPVCEPAVRLVSDLACPDCEVTVHNLNEGGAQKAASYAIKTVPAVVVDGQIVSFCGNRGPDREELGAAGIGEHLA